MSKEKTFKYRIHNLSASSWLRDLEYDKYINYYYKDLENRINNFKNWIQLLEMQGKFNFESNFLKNKIKVYKLISKNKKDNFLKVFFAVIKSWKYLCIREILAFLLGLKLILS